VSRQKVLPVWGGNPKKENLQFFVTFYLGICKFNEAKTTNNNRLKVKLFRNFGMGANPKGA
jgi:hypothetical protein